MPNTAEVVTTTVRGACPHDCPDTCATIVTVDASGRATRIQGAPDHPVTSGFLCAKVNRYLERTYHADRLTTPLRRVGPKGSGRFEPCSWDEVLREIGARLDAIRRGPHGPEAILPYSYAGTMGQLQGSSMDRRFFHAIGASRLNRTICAEAGRVGYMMTVGASVGTDLEGVPSADLVILWGTNTLTANPHLWPFILDARKAGARVICIDPVRTRTAEQCDEWIAPRPGTDAALALGIMHELFARDLVDHDYIERHTTGIDALRARAAEWPLARAAAVTGVAEDTIEALAVAYGTARAAFLRLNYGLQRHAGGGMAVRTIACLPALTGHWRRAGGGVSLSTSGAFAFDKAALQRPDLGPPARTINMSLLGEALTTPDAGVGGPPVDALIVYNSNPAAVAPDASAVRRGLAREDLFTVVLEHFQTDTADWADIVLPATTQLEHWDVHTAYGHYNASLNRPAIAPVGASLPNTEIFRRLAAVMQLDEPALRDDDLTLIRQALESNSALMQGVTFEALLDRGWVRLNVPRPYLPFANGAFLTPSGKCEFVSPRLAALGLDPVPTYIPPYESAESDPLLAARFPLQLISSPAHQFLNSSFVNIASLRRAAREPECVMHPDDAGLRGIADAQLVQVSNDRGAFQARVRISDGIRPGVAWAPSIWWTKLSPDGRNVNETTSQRLTDLGEAPVFYDNLVEITPIG
ncbi:MAG: molybdopterin oxidoreductase family protein [Gemmatimonadaceae bacterium]|nr:molybdopterin oxidoreductase family protein [Gemmatimonadaceae bacterium]